VKGSTGWNLLTRGGLWSAVVALALALGGCPAQPAATREVVVYCALDRLYAQPVLDAFQARTGIVVRAKWDTEATKTTGLVEALRASPGTCDVFWNNEVSQTAALAREGLLAAYDSPSAAGLPASVRAPTWTGFAARARVLLLNTQKIPAGGPAPTSVRDLLDPRWRGRCAIARPLFGTTATHVAALLATGGPDGLRAFLRGLVENQVVVAAGNAAVKDLVARGEVDFGLTDSDDANLALEAGSPVRVVFPDQGSDQPGALLIPNSVAILDKAPHPAEARALVDELLTLDVEARLAASRSAQVPLRAAAARPAWIPADLRTFDVAWGDVAAAFAPARDLVKAELLKE
jgi:iron(III) transport system substrate-binding protein